MCYGVVSLKLPRAVIEAADQDPVRQNRPGVHVSCAHDGRVRHPAEKQAQADKDAVCAVLDTNHDGKISKEEFMARTSDKGKGLEVFEKCDTGKKAA